MGKWLSGLPRSLLVVVVPFVTIYYVLLYTITLPSNVIHPHFYDPMTYFQSKVSALVKVHKRPDIAVSFDMRIYPNLTIVMVDDSPEVLTLPLPPTAHYIRVQTDSGISYGRNVGVRNINTTYTLLMDDDWLLSNASNLLEAFRLLETNHTIGIVAGQLCNKEPLDACYGYQGSIGIIDGFLTYKDKVAREEMENGCKLVELGENAFIARTEVLLQNPWDVNLKNAEHEDFYMALKDTVNVASCPWFKHLPTQGTPAPSRSL